MGLPYEVGDIVTLKKVHPCGSRDLTNVTIQGKEMGAALVYQAEKCRFFNMRPTAPAATA